MGSVGIETAYKAAKGEAIEANVDTGTEMATKENAADFTYQTLTGCPTTSSVGHPGTSHP